ncbi:MAG: TetR/AcrR family transcriptional regulator [FCB group bacterium]|nr:TetR/AcrR family transcriptional regulator [FCB group bacterium]MBL7028038.1 TetR/AcrR family transcriptional regulator [Candidatus Neomarinimicrobiota bacterium]MBL7122776.1 TetR/AcrR family transcriptional regulator [Candidatus Neomarinimicrobiota bacterium]
MTRKTFPSSNKSEDLILEHGFELIHRDGIRSFTVENLAQDLGMSKKTIYKFFPSKEQLLEKMFEFASGQVVWHFQKIMEKEPTAIHQIIRILGLLSNTASKISIQRIGDIKIRYPKIWRRMEEFRLNRRDDFLAIFKLGQEQGLIRQELDVALTATMFMHILNSTFQPEFFIQNNLNPTQAFKAFREIFLRGMLTDEGVQILEELT